MAFAKYSKVATAGNVGKGGFANSKTVAYQNTGATPLLAGRFVALSDKGVANLSKVTDCVAGVVVRNVIKDETITGALCDVMHIGTGDSIWVEVAEGETVKRGDKVYAVAKANGAKLVGTIQGKADATNCIETAFRVITVSENIAEITRL